MKKIILLFAFVVMTTSVIAQQGKSYIEVTGIERFDKPVKKYVVGVVISLALIYESSDTTTTIEMLKEQYFKKLTKVNFDTKKLKEDKFGYLGLGFQKEGFLFMFETASKEECMRILGVNLKGTQVYSKYLIYELNQEVSAEFAEKAIEKAKIKAELIANIAGKKIGDVLELVDSNVSENKEMLYYDNTGEKGYYKVVVKYELLKRE